MTALAVARALWPGLRTILKAIGRWIIVRVRRKGAQRIAWYMEERIAVFKARLGRARSGRRRQWLHGRIRRWSSAVRFLLKHARRLNEAAARALEEMAERAAIPINAAIDRAA